MFQQSSFLPLFFLFLIFFLLHPFFLSFFLSSFLPFLKMFANFRSSSCKGGNFYNFAFFLLFFMFQKRNWRFFSLRAIRVSKQRRILFFYSLLGLSFYLMSVMFVFPFEANPATKLYTPIRSISFLEEVSSPTVLLLVSYCRAIVKLP